MIEKFPHHYSFENPASVYDEESMTALELAGRQGAKINEVIKAFNDLEKETGEHLVNQDEAIDHIREVVVPDDVRKECVRLIESGEFDAAINLYMDNLNARVNNLLGSMTQGGTTMDAEIIDARQTHNSKVYPNLGEAMRKQFESVFGVVASPLTEGFSEVIGEQPNMTVTMNNGVAEISGSVNSAGYCGFNVNTLQNYTDLVGKTVVVVIHENTFYEWFNVLASPQGYNWANCHQVGTFNPRGSNIYTFTIPAESAFTGETWLGIQMPIHDKGENRIRLSLYVIDNRPGATIAGRAVYAENCPPVTVVKSAGHTRVNKSGFWYFGAGADYLSEYDEKDTFNVRIGDFEGDTPQSWTYYAGFAIDIKEIKNRLKYIYIECDNNININALSRVTYNWSNMIAHLNPGWNRVDHLNLDDESEVYFTAGISKPSTGCEGNVKAYFICDDDIVFASHIVNDEGVGAKYITAWGDSLTAMGGWTDRLAALSGLTLYNGGTGGETARTIVARQGADVMMVNNITIPADQQPVTLARYPDGIPTQLGHHATPLLQGGVHVNPVRLGDVEGTLAWTGSSYNDASGLWTFTRSEPGEAVTINRPTAITTAYDRTRNSPHLMILYVGANGGYDSIEELVNLHRLMITHAKAKHVLVLGMTTGGEGHTAASQAAYDAAMKNAFGRYFVSLRDYLSKYGLDDAGLTPTSADRTYMNQGAVPPQLLTDGVHYTEACKTVIGNMLYKKCCELNIF